MARSKVTDLGEFYREQGAKLERERILKWLGEIDVELAKVAFSTDPETSENEKADAAAGHSLIVQLQSRLSES